MTTKDTGEKIVVAGLRGKTWNVSKVRDMFVVFGTVQDVTLAKAGSAVVTFKFADDAAEAVFNMNGADLEGGHIRVERAMTPGKDLAITSSKHAVWEGSVKRANAEGEEDDNL